MGDCRECGEAVQWKNAAGHYRDICEDCVSGIDPADRARGDLSRDEWVRRVLAESGLMD